MGAAVAPACCDASASTNQLVVGPGVATGSAGAAEGRLGTYPTPRTATLPQLQDWDKLSADDKRKVQSKLEAIVQSFAKELVRGKVFMKLGRNGRLFYRLCTLDREWSAFSMHIKGSIVEYPFANMLHVAFGFDLTDFTHVPVSLPSDALAAVLVMDNRRLNLVFSSPMERDEFVTCMLVLIEREKARRRGLGSWWSS